MLHSLLIASAFMLAIAPGHAFADAVQPAPRPIVAKDATAGGTHWRLPINKYRGVVHAWIPANYDPATAGVVIYIHGFYTNVDKSWNERGLATQFAKSKRNALFIVCEAPSWGEGRVNWSSPNDLIVTVRQRTNVQRPWGDVVVVGHSGAHRTIRRWLTYRRLNHIILLDAMYGHASKYTRWLAQTKSQRENRLTIVALDTLPWTEALWRKRKDMVSMDRIPASVAEVPILGRNARLLYMRSQHSHMWLVLGKRVIPMLLKLTRLPSL